ncbi:unnamed protein product [Brassicogethes aeneus]|uniref:Cilia- and flagella-associated protein 53 n=1 Tax=Brassicogethes aeneus TaxID=1431903 RepID=A0A9P0B0J3_BRAAE|nr:unnamed protein product [Brassicogethes aeneus]
MFGYYEKPRNNTKCHAKHEKLKEINLPGVAVGSFMHVGKEPNTNKHIRDRDARMKKSDGLDSRLAEEKRKLLMEIVVSESEKTGNNIIFRRKVNDKVDQKLKQYEKTIAERRARLSELLEKDEKQFYYETVDKAQKSDQSNFEEMAKRAKEIRANREAERLKLAEEKRLQQYAQRSEDLRLLTTKKLLYDTKEANLIQMKENQMKKEREKETEHMWHQITMKEIQEKALREEQDLLLDKQKKGGITEVWEKQIQGKHLVEAERERLKIEDRMELDRLHEEINKCELADQVNYKEIQRKYAEELTNQIKKNQEFIAYKKHLENTFEEEIAELVRKEIEAEKRTVSDNRNLLQRETKMYRQHLADLQKQRKEDEIRLDELLEIHQKEVTKQKDEAYCKEWNKKEKLNRDVIKGRHEQMELKKERQRHEEKMKQMEKEMNSKIYEMNNCLEREMERKNLEMQKQYQDELSQQIHYNDILKQREVEHLEEQCKRSLIEEEYYQRKIKDVANFGLLGRQKHQFQIVLEKNNKIPQCCPCPEQNK